MHPLLLPIKTIRKILLDPPFGLVHVTADVRSKYIYVDLPMITLFFGRVFALLLIVILSPLLLAISLLIRFHMGPPAIFIQARTGLNEKPFNLYKFRTMSHPLTSAIDLTSDKLRITKLGSFLRSTSLDELPQLFNILLGQMTFVGPRPLPVEYLSHYTSSQRSRHQVLPGLTGLAQVNGRNLLSWSEKLSLDEYYAKHKSLHLDVLILCATIKLLLTRKGVDLPVSTLSSGSSLDLS